MKKKACFGVFAVLVVMALVFSSCSNPTSGVINRDVPENGLTDALNWLDYNATSNSSYNLKITGDQEIAGKGLKYGIKKNITITLSAVSGNSTIKLLGEGPIFIIDEGVTLVLEDGITLQGHNEGKFTLVEVYKDGKLVMNNGAKITGNKCSFGSGGVCVYDDGIFIMNGGEISANETTVDGGGVAVFGTFEMNGGKIFGNKCNGWGGGVFVSYVGVFSITNGTIYGYAAGVNANTAGIDGNALYNDGTAQYGTGGTWTPLPNDIENNDFIVNDGSL